MNEDKASRYHRLKRQASIISLLWGVVLLGGLIATGWSGLFRNAAEVMAGRIAPASWQPGATVLVYVVLLSLLNELVSLPLGFYSGFLLERRYDLSNETLRAWAGDQAKSFGIGLVLGGGAVAVIYALIRLSPDHWWLTSGAVFALLIVGLTNLAPVVLLPMFYSVKPLDRDALRTRLLALAERAGARVLGAYEWGSPAGPGRRMRRSPGLARRAGSSCPTRCWPSIQTMKSRPCWRTRLRITCTATSGRGSCSKAC